MSYVVTKMVCPSCRGSGKFCALSAPCLWCRGAKRLAAKDAVRYADRLYTIAVGGYVCGDHDYADKVRMERDAEKICAIVQRTPPWQKAA